MEAMMKNKYKPVLINLIKPELLVIFFFSLPIIVLAVTYGWSFGSFVSIGAVIISVFLSGISRVLTYSEIEITDTNIKITKGLFIKKRTAFDFSIISDAIMDRYPRLGMFNRIGLIYVKKGMKSVFSIYESYYTNEQFEEIHRLLQDKIDRNHEKK